jgi:predicted ATPase
LTKCGAILGPHESTPRLQRVSHGSKSSVSFWPASVYLGWAAVDEGRGEDGLRQIRQGVDDALATGSQQFVTNYLGLLAEAQLRAAQPEAGLQAIDEAFAIIDRTGERFYEAPLHCLRGELLLVADPETRTRESDEAFGRALDIAQGQGAKLLAVRAAISRSRLWSRLGRHTRPGNSSARGAMISART